MKLRIVMCEGAHDIGFISKILLANGYKAYEKRIKDYPYPINVQIERNLSRESVGDSKLGFKAEPLVPYSSFYKEDILLLLHNMGGDKTVEDRYKLIEDYEEIFSIFKEEIVLEKQEISDISYFLFYDADDMGIVGRIDLVRDLFASKYNIPVAEINNGEKNQSGDIILGVYVFHSDKDGQCRGTLEDQLIDLIEIDNSEIVKQAEHFLVENKLGEERTKEYYIDNDKYKGSNKYDKKKSIISVAGQLEISGMNNSVIIAKSDYIKKNTVLANTQCICIYNLLNE